MSERQVKPEATGGRDELLLSAWHRKLGWDYPATDIDLLMIEYNYGKPYALVEYKRMNGKKISKNHPSFRAMSELANGVNIPAIVVRYSPELDMFRVSPLNTIARGLVPVTTIMTEDQYINLMGEMKKRFKERADNNTSSRGVYESSTAATDHREHDRACDSTNISDLTLPKRSDGNGIVNLES